MLAGGNKISYENYKKEIMKTDKKPFKLSVLGIFRLESENMNLVEIIITMMVVMMFVIAIIILLKSYALPVLSAPGIINKIGSVTQLFKSKAS